MVAILIVSLVGILVAVFANLGEFLPFYINTLFLGIAKVFFYLIDFCQSLFKKLAGLEFPEGVDETDPTASEPLFKLLNNVAVQQVLITLTLVAIALVIIFAIIQIIRLEYTTEGAKNSKSKILQDSLKALAMFVIVPISCLFGVALSNAILKIIDSATSSGNGTIAGEIFVAAAYDANPARSGEIKFHYTNTEGFSLKMVENFENEAMGGFNEKGKSFIGLDNITWKGDPTVGEDAVFQYNNDATLSGLSAAAFSSNLGGKTGDQLALAIDNMFKLNPDERSAVNFDGIVLNGEKIGYDNIKSIQYFYNIQDINFVILFMCCVFAFKCLIAASFGLVMRLYTVTVLFMISPPIVAMTTLDGGNAFKNWRGKFISNVLSAYGTIVALNVFFMIMGIMSEIKLFPAEKEFYNNLIHVLFVLVGCYMLQDISKTISGIIGAEDASTQGEGMQKKVTDGVKKAAGNAIKVGVGTAMLGRGISSAISRGRTARQLDNARKDIAQTDKEIAEQEEIIKTETDPDKNAAAKARKNELVGKRESLVNKADEAVLKNSQAFAKNAGARSWFGSVIDKSNVGKMISDSSGGILSLGGFATGTGASKFTSSDTQALKSLYGSQGEIMAGMVKNAREKAILDPNTGADLGDTTDRGRRSLAHQMAYSGDRSLDRIKEAAFETAKQQNVARAQFDKDTQSGYMQAVFAVKNAEDMNGSTLVNTLVEAIKNLKTINPSNLKTDDDRKELDDRIARLSAALSSAKAYDGKTITSNGKNDIQSAFISADKNAVNNNDLWKDIIKYSPAKNISELEGDVSLSNLNMSASELKTSVDQNSVDKLAQAIKSGDAAAISALNTTCKAMVNDFNSAVNKMVNMEKSQKQENNSASDLAKILSKLVK